MFKIWPRKFWQPGRLYGNTMQHAYACVRCLESLEWRKNVVIATSSMTWLSLCHWHPEALHVLPGLFMPTSCPELFAGAAFSMAPEQSWPHVEWGIFKPAPAGEKRTASESSDECDRIAQDLLVDYFSGVSWHMYASIYLSIYLSILISMYIYI